MFEHFIGKGEIGFDYETRKKNVPLIVENRNIEDDVKIIQTGNHYSTFVKIK